MKLTKRLFPALLAAAFLLPAGAETAAEKAARLQWWSDARFGMFIHFGLYAMPARHEWIRHYERIPNDVYDTKYYARFNPDLFDAKAWAKAAKAAGMKYMVLTTKHHEGFCMWDTKTCDYKITNTPFGRDLVREYVDACRAEGLHVGIYFSLIDWHHPDFPVDCVHPMFPFDLAAKRFDTGYVEPKPGLDEKLAELNRNRSMDRFRDVMFAQVRELLTNYGKIDIIFYDYTYDKTKYGKSAEDWHSRELLKMTRELQPGIIVNDRLGLTKEGGFDIYTPEQVVVPSCPKLNGEEVAWEVCQTFSGSWGYARDEDTWKSPNQLLIQLIDGVSKKGNLLLNVGPTARGEFDCRAKDRLSAMGAWLHSNGRAIYGCTAAPEELRGKCPEGCKLTYNPKTNRLYLHILEWPIKVLPITFADKVAYSQLLHDGSEVFIKIPLNVAGEPRTDVPASLLLPVKKPATEIPVVEMFLK